MLEMIEHISDNSKLRDTEQIYLEQLDPEYNISKNVFYPQLGRHLTREHKASQSKSWTKSRKKKQSLRMSGRNNPNYGIAHSDKSKAKISKSHNWLGKKHKKSTKTKISSALSGLQKTSAHKRNLSASWTPEKRRLSSQAQSGEGNHSAKINFAKAREIRRLYSTGKWTQKALATKFRVGRTTIGNVTNNRSWKE